MGASAKLRVTCTGPPHPLALGLHDRHPVQGDLASGRRDPPHRAHHRIDAGRQTFADIGARLSAIQIGRRRLQPEAHAEDVAEGHGGDDIAAARIEEDDAPQLSIRTVGFEKVDERLRRIRLDHAVGDNHVGQRAPQPPVSQRFERERSSTRARRARPPARASRKARAARRTPLLGERMVGGDGLEPPTLSV